VLRDLLAPPAGVETAKSRLAAPMPGKILAVHVAPGASVKRGQLLLVLEAMKMEHAITAPADGVVEAVNFAAGDVVDEGALLIAFAAL
jgi:3-methylcrotonyl-CoA carboxylase alpha subunit